MTLTQVLYALAVARYLNFSRAADSLFVSQPALSLQIKNLEKELGYDLFVRTPHGILLTELGEQFCRDARAVALSSESTAYVLGVSDIRFCDLDGDGT